MSGKKKWRILLLSVLLVMLWVDVPIARSTDLTIDPDSYPIISDQEMGQMRWTLMVANQALDDYSNMEAQNQVGMTSYRYLIAFSSYFLATEQFHKLPAWTEALQPALDKSIQRMIQKPVWEFWAKTSQGVPNLEPNLNKPYPENRDPVSYRNIMYSGHLGHMINLYEMLYRDFKWDRSGSIVFAWADREKYVYDNHSLEKVMYEQMKNNPWHSIECEPNAVFPECNQHPVLSFILYDYTHGAHLSEVRDQFMDFFLKNKLIAPNTHQTAMCYLVKQKITISDQDPRFGNLLDLAVTPIISLGIVGLDSPSADGWTGAFMHAWQPDYIARHYPYQLKRLLKSGPEPTVRLKKEIWEPRSSYGFFAVYAAEMGDLKTRDGILAYADQTYQPAWLNGAYHYPYNLKQGCTNLTDRLLALGRANPKDGLWKMHNQPFDPEHFSEPKLSGVDFPKVLILRAIYDRDKKALIITVKPGDQKSGFTGFNIVQLDQKKSYRLLIDGKEINKYAGQTSIPVKINLDQERDLILMED